MQEFKPAIYFEFLADVVDPETQRVIIESGSVELADVMNDLNDLYGLDEFVGRAMYCDTIEAFERLTGLDWQ